VTNSAGAETITQVAYGDAQTRGRMRLWKRSLANGYEAFSRAFLTRATSDHVIDFVRRSSSIGRKRAFDKLHRAFGPGVMLEGLRIEGEHPIAVWSILKPRSSVIIDAPVESGLAQDCVTVNYVIAGAWNNEPNIGEGLWSLEIPDHAIGRAIDRSGGDPRTSSPDRLIIEAHHNVLQLKVTDVMRDGVMGTDHRFLVKAGAGGFICAVRIAEDVSLHKALNIYVRADTWINECQLHDDQTLLLGNGARGERLGDSCLMPAPPRELVDVGDNGVQPLTWSPGLPELIGSATAGALRN
jgi:hypothetical protein